VPSPHPTIGVVGLLRYNHAQTIRGRTATALCALYFTCTVAHGARCTCSSWGKYMYYLCFNPSEAVLLPDRPVDGRFTGDDLMIMVAAPIAQSHATVVRAYTGQDQRRGTERERRAVENCCIYPAGRCTHGPEPAPARAPVRQKTPLTRDRRRVSSVRPTRRSCLPRPAPFSPSNIYHTYFYNNFNYFLLKN
jgi:hypothetical protein